MPLVEIVHQSFSPSNVVPKAVVGPPSSMRRIAVTPSDQQNWDASPVRLRRCAYLCWTNRDLSWLHWARAAGPLSAKAAGKPPSPSSISTRLRAKMIEADPMSRHVPLLRWTRLCRGCGGMLEEGRHLRKMQIETCGSARAQPARRHPSSSSFYATRTLQLDQGGCR